MKDGDILEYKHGYLKDANPGLYAELDIEKNKGIDISQLSATSGKRVWWKCKKCGYSWQKRVIDRFTGKGCAVCANQKLLKGYNDLQTKYPELLKEWDYNKNNLAPSEVIAGGHTKYYWICEKGHSYENRVLKRASGVGCPICDGKVVLKGYNDLQSKYPKLAEEWDFNKNKEAPDKVHFGSNKKAYWICKKGHRWAATIQSRTLAGNNCPDCAKELKISFPEKAVAYYLKKAKVNIIENYRPDFLNGKEIDIYIPNKKIGIEYDGNRWHKDIKKDKHKDKICNENNITLYRIRENECPKYNSTSKMILLLNHTFDELEKSIDSLFHHLNIKYIDININRDQANIEEMIERSEKKNSLVIMRPELAKEWDYDKNGIMRPENYSCKSDVKVWWKCLKCGSSYQLPIRLKYNNVNSCSFCANKRLMPGYNDLASTHPELAKEWDYEKNEIKPNEVISYGDRKVFWICRNCGYRWSATIYSRKSGCGCPQCSKERRIIKNSKSVIQLSFTGEIVGRYISVSSASKQTGIKHIDDVCRGVRKQAGGYIWKYENKKK